MRTKTSNTKLCCSLTKKGNRCKNKVLSVNGTGHCRDHSVSYNDECPICLSPVHGNILLECLHRMHWNCAAELKSPECPICRRPAIFPRKLQKIINDRLSDDLEPDTASEANFQDDENLLTSVILDTLSECRLLFDPSYVPQFVSVSEMVDIDEVPGKIYQKIKKNSELQVSTFDCEMLID